MNQNERNPEIRHIWIFRTAEWDVIGGESARGVSVVSPGENVAIRGEGLRSGAFSYNVH